MARNYRTKAIILSFVHLLMAVLSIVFGVASIRIPEADFNKGLYGMGIWLGVWMVLTCIACLLTASAEQPVKKCRITCLIGFCCYSVVALTVCCLPLIVGPINHFSFELRVSKDYFKKFGPESMYSKPESYFEERNRKGRIGCAIYGALLGVIQVDIIVSVVTCVIWKQVLNKRVALRRRLQQRNAFLGSLNSGFSHSLAFLTDAFVVDDHQHPKLPSYEDIFPNGQPTWETEILPPPLDHAPPPYLDTIPSHNDCSANEPNNVTINTCMNHQNSTSTSVTDSEAGTTVDESNFLGETSTCIGGYSTVCSVHGNLNNMSSPLDEMPSSIGNCTTSVSSISGDLNNISSQLEDPSVLPGVVQAEAPTTHQISDSALGNHAMDITNNDSQSIGNQTDLEERNGLSNVVIGSRENTIISQDNKSRGNLSLELPTAQLPNDANS